MSESFVLILVALVLVLALGGCALIVALILGHTVRSNVKISPKGVQAELDAGGRESSLAPRED